MANKDRLKSTELAALSPRDYLTLLEWPILGPTETIDGLPGFARRPVKVENGSPTYAVYIQCISPIKPVDIHLHQTMENGAAPDETFFPISGKGEIYRGLEADTLFGLLDLERLLEYDKVQIILRLDYVPDGVVRVGWGGGVFVPNINSTVVPRADLINIISNGVIMLSGCTVKTGTLHDTNTASGLFVCLSVKTPQIPGLQIIDKSLSLWDVRGSFKFS